MTDESMPEQLSPWPGQPRARAAEAAGGLGFPDVPRLELDQLLVQLADRADDVRATQGRLRGLLRANALVAGELSLPVVLRQVVGAARDLLGARYAALGVLGHDGGLEQFVHAGMDEELVARVGDLPRGRGILGLLISEPVPTRLADLAAHPASAGFPPEHPPMTSFLGVPIRTGDKVFGHLYLTERYDGGEFTAEDEELAIALAATASAAIANARRFTESEQRRRWLDASGELTPLLLSSQVEQLHALITELAAAAAAADFAALAVPDGADGVIITGVTGALTAGMMDRTALLADSPAGQAILTGKPSLVTGGRREAVAAALNADIGPMIVVPLAAGEQVRGALMLGRLAANPEFTETDLDMAASFAGHAAVAMELARARIDQIVLARAEDHDRIAGDLHDHVIQELFALSMTLQGDAARGDPAAATRIKGYVEVLDKAIANIRTSIFGLHQSRAAPADLHAQLRAVIEEHTPQLGFTAAIRFAGPLDPGPGPDLAHDIIAVTREALSNCARHAHATAISVSLAQEAGLIILDVLDNGRGVGTPARSSGLTSMRHRAERSGGTFQLTTPGSGGTHLTWTALLSHRRVLAVSRLMPSRSRQGRLDHLTSSPRLKGEGEVGGVPRRDLQSRVHISHPDPRIPRLNPALARTFRPGFCRVPFADRVLVVIRNPSSRPGLAPRRAPGCSWYRNMRTYYRIPPTFPGGEATFPPRPEGRCLHAAILMTGERDQA